VSDRQDRETDSLQRGIAQENFVMKKFDIYCGVFWLVMALFVCTVSLLKFGLGNFRYPGPGFFPFLIGLILFFLSIGMIRMAIKERLKSLDFKQWPALHRNVAMTMLVLFAYAFSLETLGYAVGSFLLFVYLFRFPSGKRWWVSVLLSIVIVAITYYFFGVLLQTQFPKGVLNI
jgi:putative tricarboxylic transport membrane protein